MSNKKKILVVDDEQDVLIYLTALFQDNGYEVITAKDGVEGFDLAKKEKPDLITLDITMPDQSGVRTYRYYKGNDELKEIPVIIITAIGDSMRSFLKKLSGFPEPEGFMNKPIDEKTLLKMVSDLLGKS
ncbi:MAG: response regulator [Desulfobacterium sp.]|nr:response regulator [Desulfobacterium sp.]